MASITAGHFSPHHVSAEVECRIQMGDLPRNILTTRPFFEFSFIFLLVDLPGECGEMHESRLQRQHTFRRLEKIRQRLESVSHGNRVFHDLTTIQECQYYQLHFGCAFQNLNDRKCLQP